LIFILEQVFWYHYILTYSWDILEIKMLYTSDENPSKQWSC
jgi:hypothetical protein